MTFYRVFTGKFKGQIAFSDGVMICVGKPPKAKQIVAFKKKNAMDKAATGIIPKRPSKATTNGKILPVLLFKCIDFAPGKCRVQKQYVAFIEREHPKAAWFIGNKWGHSGERPLLRIQPNKKVVGVIMPMRQAEGER